MYRRKECLFAYLAGAIDSDGFISIQKSARKNKAGEKHVYFNAKLGFTSTSHTIVQNLMKENFGGSVHSYKPSNPNYKVWSVWQVSDRQAYDALMALLPYLIVKKKQAQLVIDFVNACRQQREEMKCTQRPPYHVTRAMFNVRLDYWQQVGNINASAGSEPAMTAMATPHYSPLFAANRLLCLGPLFIMGIISGITNANQFIFDSGILSV